MKTLHFGVGLDKDCHTGEFCVLTSQLNQFLDLNLTKLG